MNDTDLGKADFIRQRRAGMTAILAAMPVALLLWLAIAYLVPPLTGMDSLGGRMVFALKCSCLAVLFCLVTGVEAVAHERLSSPAFDPLSGFELGGCKSINVICKTHWSKFLCLWPGFLVSQSIAQTAPRCGPY